MKKALIPFRIVFALSILVIGVGAYSIRSNAMGLTESVYLYELFTSYGYISTMSGGAHVNTSNNIYYSDSDIIVQNVSFPTDKILNDMNMDIQEFKKKVQLGWGLYVASLDYTWTYYFKNETTNEVDTASAISGITSEFYNTGVSRAEILTDYYTKSIPKQEGYTKTPSLVPFYCTRNQDINSAYYGSYSVVNSCNLPLYLPFYNTSDGTWYILSEAYLSNAGTYQTIMYSRGNLLGTDNYAIRYDKQMLYSGHTIYIYRIDNFTDIFYGVNYDLPACSSFNDACKLLIDVVPSDDSISILKDSLGDVYTVPDIQNLLGYGVALGDVYELVNEIKQIIENGTLNQDNSITLDDTLIQSIANAITQVKAKSEVITSEVVEYDGEIPAYILTDIGQLFDLPQYVFSSIFKPFFDIFDTYSMYSLFLLFPSIILGFFILRCIIK